MSIRRNSGDIVVKKENAGFCKQKLLIRIPTIEIFKQHGFEYQTEKEDQGTCLLNCGDKDCIEYANVEEIDENYNHIGWIYHVSECQLDD